MTILMYTKIISELRICKQTFIIVVSVKKTATRPCPNTHAHTHKTIDNKFEWPNQKVWKISKQQQPPKYYSATSRIIERSAAIE